MKKLTAVREDGVIFHISFPELRETLVRAFCPESNMKQVAEALNDGALDLEELSSIETFLQELGPRSGSSSLEDVRNMLADLGESTKIVSSFSYAAIYEAKVAIGSKTESFTAVLPSADALSMDEMLKSEDLKVGEALTLFRKFAGWVSPIKLNEIEDLERTIRKHYREALVPVYTYEPIVKIPAVFVYESCDVYPGYIYEISYGSKTVRHFADSPSSAELENLLLNRPESNTDLLKAVYEIAPRIGALNSANVSSVPEGDVTWKRTIADALHLKFTDKDYNYICFYLISPRGSDFLSTLTTLETYKDVLDTFKDEADFLFTPEFKPSTISNIREEKSMDKLLKVNKLEGFRVRIQWNGTEAANYYFNDSREFLDSIVEGARDLKELINDLLADGFPITTIYTKEADFPPFGLPWDEFNIPDTYEYDIIQENAVVFSVQLKSTAKFMCVVIPDNADVLIESLQSEENLAEFVSEHASEWEWLVPAFANNIHALRRSLYSYSEYPRNQDDEFEESLEEATNAGDIAGRVEPLISKEDKQLRKIWGDRVDTIDGIYDVDGFIGGQVHLTKDGKKYKVDLSDFELLKPKKA